MRHNRPAVAYVAACTSALILLAANLASAQRAVSVLWVGNSFTQRWNTVELTTEIVNRGLAQQEIRIARWEMSIAWATTMKYHWQENDLNGKNAVDLIRQNHYDFVVLQDYMMDTAASGYNNDSMRAYNAKFIAEVKSYGGVPIVACVWPNKTEQTKWPSLIRCYDRMARDYGAAFAPLSVVWRKVLAEHPDYPLWEEDGHHAYFAGAYVNACVYYTVMTGKSPSPNPCYGSFTADSAAYMQRMAWSVCDSALQPRWPQLAITSPANGGIITGGAQVRCAASATSMTGGALAASAITWRSSLSGLLGTGLSLTLDSLRSGNQFVTCTVVDSNRTVSRSVNVTVLRRSAQPMTDMAMWLKMDETSGTALADSSGRSNAGVLTGGVAGRTGKLGRAVQFDGTGDYVRVASLTAYDSAFTVSAWFKPSNLGGNGMQYPYSHGNNWGQPAVAMAWTGSATTDNWLGKSNYWPFACRSESQAVKFSGASMLDTGWHLYSLTVDRSGLTSVYIDSSAQGYLQLSGTGVITPASTLTIGANSQTLGDGFTGLIDDVRVYRRALTYSEVIALSTLTGESAVGVASAARAVHPARVSQRAVSVYAIDGRLLRDRQAAAGVRIAVTPQSRGATIVRLAP